MDDERLRIPIMESGEPVPIEPDPVCRIADALERVAAAMERMMAGGRVPVDATLRVHPDTPQAKPAGLGG